MNKRQWRESEDTDGALEMAALRLEHRATSEQIDVDRGPMRDGKTAQRLYAIQVLREEADWIRRCKSGATPQ